MAWKAIFTQSLWNNLYCQTKSTSTFSTLKNMFKVAVHTILLLEASCEWSNDIYVTAVLYVSPCGRHILFFPPCMSVRPSVRLSVTLLLSEAYLQKPFVQKLCKEFQKWNTYWSCATKNQNSILLKLLEVNKQDCSTLSIRHIPQCDYPILPKCTYSSLVSKQQIAFDYFYSLCRCFARMSSILVVILH